MAALWRSSQTRVEFCNQLVDQLEDLTGFKHKITSAYHPQSNGLNERFVLLCSTSPPPTHQCGRTSPREHSKAPRKSLSPREAVLLSKSYTVNFSFCASSNLYSIWMALVNLGFWSFFISSVLANCKNYDIVPAHLGFIFIL